MADFPRNGLTPAERAQLIKAIESRDTSIIREHLAEALGVQPDWETLGKKNPSLLVQAWNMLSQMCGYYVPKSEQQINGFLGYIQTVLSMSDSEFELEYQKRYGPKPAKVIDITPQSGAPAQDDTPPASPRAAHP